MEYESAELLVELVFLVSLWTGLGVCAYLLAKRKGYSKILWVVLTMVPLVNVFAMMYFIGVPPRTDSRE